VGHQVWRGHRWVNGGWYPAIEPGVLIEPAAGVDACMTVVNDEDTLEACRVCVVEGGSWAIEDATCI
jgi:hypothetical protein